MNNEVKELTDREWLLNKYFRYYNMIIDRAIEDVIFRSKDDKTYYERHHIIPTSLGGNDNVKNLAILTQREHYLCHYLLTRFTFGDDYRSMVLAFAHSHTNDHTGRRTHFSRILKEANAKKHSLVISGEGNPMYGKKRPEHSINMTGDKNPFFGKKHTLETRQAIGNKKKGKMLGSENPSAVSWILTDPNGKEITFKGELKNMCKKLNLSPVSLKKSLGLVVIYNRHARGAAYKNTIGWKLEAINA